MCVGVDRIHLFLGVALEHGVHEAAEHYQQLLLIDVAQPQRGPTSHYCVRLCYGLCVCVGQFHSQEGQVVSDVSADRVVHVTAEPAEVHSLDELASHLVG